MKLGKPPPLGGTHWDLKWATSYKILDCLRSEKEMAFLESAIVVRASFGGWL